MEERLSAQELLKYSRHDHMNTLHLIRMMLDLGKEDGVRQAIDDAVEKARHESALGAMDMPGLAVWLLTFGWRFPEYEVSLDVATDGPGDREADAEAEAFLEELFSVLQDGLSPYAEYGAQIRVKTESGAWSATFTLTGPHQLQEGLAEASPDARFTFHHSEEDGQLMMTVAGRKVDR
ncbi:Sporulation initiation phosphotransferase B [Bhargavaea cecembensis DSE10]|uniref:Sporulation initiation phosphotransferase B n=1 Tax=Bhargavaea cecembensis DSE10 TaxID=1235279 RepID=M7NF77_9BACL|nr:Spo0B domain-containing protein [Bhargavaea cecembensis]EMR05826.1 Sporulation initiation phosphotransferase B [Bhargavaea cecembensis DSE10]